MTYRVNLDRVSAEVEQFTGEVLKAWTAVLNEISINPYPRFGLYVDRAIPVRGIPMRTWVYEIALETSISGEFVFTGEFVPLYAPVYVVVEETQEILVLNLRESTRA